MSGQTTNIETLTQALEAFTRSSQAMEEAYRRLEARIAELDRALESKNRELALTTEYLSNLLESMSDGVIAVNTEDVVTRFNRAAAAILGYEPAEVIGHLFHEVFGRVFAAPRIPGAMELRAKSGRMVPINERDSVVEGHGKRLGRVKTFQDLSEIIALREQLRQMDRLAAIGEMAATVAHEIRNPLGGIRGFAAFLAQDIPQEDPRRRLVDKINEGVKSLDRVVTELLEFTRPVELNLTRCACVDIVRDALGYLEYEPARISIRMDLDAGLRIRGDAEKLRQVLLNVLLNAVQSIEAKGEIHLRAEADDTYVALSVRDTGCGMTEEQLKSIFSPFYTTKEKGTGLGLALCLKIIEGHGGDIKAESTPGQGSVITLRLPRTE
ncbi:MAG TPA: ATP-binding protein [Candidatus Hydrogenedentes bacterium]|nr:ATP-binding protein [Candidatus Hydrogenedentota bacterium]